MHGKKLLALGAFTLSLIFAQGNPNDDRIYDQVRMKLAADQVVGRGAVDVTVKNGVVTLDGRVRTDKQKQKAEHLTKKIKGVTSVVNNLRIEP